MDELLHGTATRDSRTSTSTTVREALATYLDGWGWNATLRTEALLAACLRRSGTPIEAAAPAGKAEAAIGALERELEAWAVFVIGQERLAERPPLLVARLAYRASGGPARWPDCFLCYDLPAAFIDAMRRAVLAPVPAESPAPMREQRFEVWGPSDLVPGWRPARRAVVLSGRR